MRTAGVEKSQSHRQRHILATQVVSKFRGFLKNGVTGTAFNFDQWTAHGRIALVLSVGQTCLLVGSCLRMRVGYFIQSLHPDYNSSEWAPFAKSLVELSLFVMVLGVGLTVISLHRWLQGSSDECRTKH